MLARTEAPQHRKTRAPRKEPAPRLGLPPCTAGTAQTAGLAYREANGQGRFLPFKRWVIAPEARAPASALHDHVMYRSLLVCIKPSSIVANGFEGDAKTRTAGLRRSVDVAAEVARVELISRRMWRATVHSGSLVPLCAHLALHPDPVPENVIPLGGVNR